MTDYPADTILAVDFGTATTRAMLFDVVEGQFRFVACGEAPTTVEPPFYEASEGMRHALADLQAIAGRFLLDDRSNLIIPSTPDGNGADKLVITSSAGPQVRALLIGLLPDVSLESARRVARSSYISVVDTLSLGDRRREEQRFDAVLKARPDLIIIAGGTDNGAREALLNILETVALACHLLPVGSSPRVLYAGNPALQEKIAELMGSIAAVRNAPNLQPLLGDAERVLTPARAEMAKIYEELRMGQIGGFMELAQTAGGRIFPTAQAEGQTIRYLKRTLNAPGGVLGVNVGSASTSLAAAFKDDLFLTVRADLGLGVNVGAVLDETPFDQFTRWLPFDCSAATVREFIYDKAAHPHTLPADEKDLHFENALVREVIRAALRRAQADWPASVFGSRTDLLPRLGLIVGSGAALSRAPRPGAAALLLLDSLQPTGVTNLLLDPHHLTAALGAMAYTNPMAVVQVAESGAYLNLGTAVSVVGEARPEAVACTARLVAQDGKETSAEVKFGALELLPLPLGRSAKLTLKPRPGADVGFGPGRGKTISVTGGAAGVIIDARGRPLVFPKDAGQRFETVQQWALKASGMV